MPHTVTDADRYRWLRAAWLQGVESDAPSEMQRAIGYAETAAEMDAAIDENLQKPENAHLLSARAGGGNVLVPRDPTPEMVDAAAETVMLVSPSDAEVKRLWAAMLAAAPAVSAPLTIEQIDEIRLKVGFAGGMARFTGFVRAIEAAHDIQAPATADGSKS